MKLWSRPVFLLLSCCSIELAPSRKAYPCEGEAEQGKRCRLGNIQAHTLLIQDKAVRHSVAFNHEVKSRLASRQGNREVDGAVWKGASGQEAVAVAAEARLVLITCTEQLRRAQELRAAHKRAREGVQAAVDEGAHEKIVEADCAAQNLRSGGIDQRAEHIDITLGAVAGRSGNGGAGVDADPVVVRRIVGLPNRRDRRDEGCVRQSSKPPAPCGQGIANRPVWIGRSTTGTGIGNDVGVR